MNKLKTYKNFNIFESKSNLDDIVDNCKDILVDILDLSHQYESLIDSVRVSSREVINFRRYIRIQFVKNLPLNEHIDDIIRLNDYLNSEGFILKNVYCNAIFKNYHKFDEVIEKIKSGEIIFPDFEYIEGRKIDPKIIDKYINGK